MPDALCLLITPYNYLLRVKVYVGCDKCIARFALTLEPFMKYVNQPVAIART